MPKRPNPFQEDYIPHSKVHVSLKRFSNNEGRLQEIYDKTLQLLFSGANKAQPLVCDSNCNGNSKIDRMKQLFLSKNGALLHSGSLVPIKTTAVADCSCGKNKMEWCAYCEIPLCSACKNHCILCSQDYCEKCFLTGFDDTAVCLSCCN